MNRNPFISRNNDLFIMYFSGAAMVLLVNFLPISMQQQFLIMLSFGFLAGVFMTYLYQSIEWALFFMVGILTVATLPHVIHIAFGGTFNPIAIIQTAMDSGEYSLFLLSSWIISIPAGFIVQKLMMNNYYRRNSI